ncbi:hypothetical protein HDV00_006210 [Rhizophlyctis rosea]|nr:hypothetical protein HDV00_006210 [Rhizophlyctis rosea]
MIAGNSAVALSAHAPPADLSATCLGLLRVAEKGTLDLSQYDNTLERKKRRRTDTDQDSDSESDIEVVDLKDEFLTKMEGMPYLYWKLMHAIAIRGARDVRKAAAKAWLRAENQELDVHSDEFKDYVLKAMEGAVHNFADYFVGMSWQDGKKEDESDVEEGSESE